VRFKAYIVDIDSVNLEVRVGLGLARVDNLLDGNRTKSLVLASATLHRLVSSSIPCLSVA
jgi:hypothetical protein